MSKLRALCITVAGLMLLLSCKDEYNICTQSKTVVFKASFYQVVNNTASLQPAPKFSLIPIDGNALYTQLPNITHFECALNPSNDSTSWTIKVADNLPADTLTLVYFSKLIMVSKACGNVFIHEVKNVRSTAHTIDSVTINKAEINLLGLENVKVYF